MEGSMPKRVTRSSTKASIPSTSCNKRKERALLCDSPRTSSSEPHKVQKKKTLVSETNSLNVRKKKKTTQKPPESQQREKLKRRCKSSESQEKRKIKGSYKSSASQGKMMKQELKSSEALEESCDGNEVSATLVNELPDEILLKIFSYIPLVDLSLNICHVCPRWQNVVNDPALWNDSKFECSIRDELSVDPVKFVSNAPLLKKLFVKYHRKRDEILKAAYRTCKDIHALEVRDMKQINASVVRDFLKKFSQLSSLEVECKMHLDIECEGLVRSFRNLRRLIIPGSDFLDGSLLRKLLDQCKNLEELDTESAALVYDEDVLYLIRKKKINLINLTLNGEMLTDTSFSQLGQLQKLEKLGLFNCEQMTDRSVESIRMLKLTSLRMCNGINLTPDAIASIFTSGNMCNLTFLDLSWCANVNDEVLEAISTNCPLLEWLYLEDCSDITPYGLQDIHEGCPRLKSLYVNPF